MASMKERMKALEAVRDRYEWMEEREIAELDSMGILLRHKKSGARVVLVLNEDDNKVFSIGFRTPPEDSTGVAHIVEHTVLCGSERYPAKDSFIELVKGSLNTFLNAMTYPDKTVYPVASCNQQDFKNLMGVYLDAVFFPAIYQHKEIFQQEGWHIEESEDGSLSYNGVVYNEMKGALSSPDDLIYDLISRALFPDNTYSQESGGDPAVIPELTYEAFLDFHRRYYHPSNSYIYLYGDLDAAERLEWMDREYLSRFDRLEIDSTIPMQEPVQCTMEENYSCEEGEEAEGEWLAYNVVTGHAADTLLTNAMQILEYVLVDVPGAPVKKALQEAGIGRDIRGMLNTDLQQPVLSFLVKNAPAGSEKRFTEILTEVLQEQIENGINKKSLLAALNFFEFRYREADYGYYPKGLVYGLMLLNSWLYQEEAPFDQLEQGVAFDKLRELVESDYFEKLIREQILDNPHRAVVTLKPEVGKNERTEKEREQKLQAYRDTLTEEELEQIRQEQKALEAYQDQPSTREELETIPLLQLSDIEKKTQQLIYEEGELAGRPILRHDLSTNGIVYLRMLYKVSDIPEEDIPYLSLLATALGYVDSEHYTYGEFANEMLLYTGGITTDLLLQSRWNQADDYDAYMEVKARYLEAQTDKALALTEEMLFHTTYGDHKRLREILAESVSRMQQRLADSGNSTAVTRGFSYLSACGMWKELSRGVAYYRFMKDLLDHFEEKKEEISEHLNALAGKIFAKERLTLSVAAGEQGYRMAVDRLEEFIRRTECHIPDGTAAGERTVLTPESRNEAFKCAGQVQYVARVGNYVKAGYQYTGSLKVLNTILSYDYLWNQVRVKGGAYGCSSAFGLDGDSYMVSYRDPNLAETEKVYEGVTEYMKQFQVDEREMTKYIIGTFSSLDTPLGPSAKAGRALSAWLRGVTEEDYQRERDEVLATTAETIRELAPLVQTVLDADSRCTVGSEAKIEKDKELFDHIERLA